MQQRIVCTKRAVLGVLLSVGLSGACQQGNQPQTAGPDVWATVDDRNITRDDVERAYRGSLNPSAPVPSEEEALNLKLNIVDELINQEVLQARAKGLAVEPTDADVDTALATRKGSVTDEAFNLELTQRGFTLDDVKRGLRRELAVQKVIEKEVNSKVNVTDQDIATFYEANRAQFNLPEAQYRLAQIVITPVREPQLRNRMGDDAATPADAQRKAQMLTERLKDGADFSVLAMDFSEDPQSVGQGGDLGFVPVSALNQLPPEFRAAVLRMQPGNIQTLTINGGHTILMLLAREEAGQRDLSSASVKENIRETLQSRKLQVLQNAYVTAARGEAKVVNHLARLIVEGQGKLPATTGTTGAPTTAR
jgi:peptidyl-prolyl cis-trans isomerase SurA